MPYNEDQQLLSDITGSPLGGPEKPSFWGSRSSPEWKQYDNYNEMQSQLQRAQFMHALDQKFHPLSLEDASRYTGVPMDQMASPDQRQNVTDISYVPSMVEGPRPMGTRPDFGEKIGERRGEPGDYITNPDELFPNASKETPFLYMGMNQDFLDKKPPYYEPGQIIDQYSTKQVPTELQGPGAPVEGQRMVESSRSQINPSAPADWVQRGLVEASLAQHKLRPPAPDKGSPEERKLEMARQYYLDPEGNKAQGVVSGAINTERQVQGTQSQMGLNKSKAENLDAQTRATQELLGTRKANLQAQTSKLKQQISELKDTEGVRKDKLGESVKLSQVMQRYYDARLEGKSADLALKEASLERGTNETYLKEIKAQLAMLHEIKPDLEDADVDSIIGSLGEKFGFQGLSRKRNLGQRLSDMFSDTERTAPEAGPVPMPQAGASKGSSQSLQFRQSSQSRVPNQGEPQGPQGQAVQAPDAGALLQQVEKSLGDVSKLEGKTIRDKKSGQQFRIQNGKPVPVK
jgi:hypothetical protein